MVKQSTTSVPAGQPPLLRDIKPPVEIPDYWRWIIMGLAVVLLAAAVFWWLRHCARLKAMQPEAPPVPAHIRARQRLNEALARIHEPEVFCVLVSDAVRQYLEERFSFHAPERTTEEFLNELSGTDLLLPDQKESLKEFLQRCDLVKFARYEPREPELHDLHGSALRLVEETEPQPEAIQAPGARLETIADETSSMETAHAQAAQGQSEAAVDADKS
ncbi:MAG TPA: hypothetical protein VHH88_01410 [Verrucomicrobiae bacterium]|nr:hypothetical protein [Verrucomicrobiae bacterium]